MEEIIARKFYVLKDELNERQRRLWAASETLSLGYGGITQVSEATGLSRTTITLGLKELHAGERLAEGRVRCEGGRSKKIRRTTAGLGSHVGRVGRADGQR